jgi:hypothetical protein
VKCQTVWSCASTFSVVTRPFLIGFRRGLKHSTQNDVANRPHALQTDSAHAKCEGVHLIPLCRFSLQYPIARGFLPNNFLVPCRRIRAINFYIFRRLTLRLARCSSEQRYRTKTIFQFFSFEVTPTLGTEIRGFELFSFIPSFSTSSQRLRRGSIPQICIPHTPRIPRPPKGAPRRLLTTNSLP